MSTKKCTARAVVEAPDSKAVLEFLYVDRKDGETRARWRRERPPERLASACDTARLGDPGFSGVAAICRIGSSQVVQAGADGGALNAFDSSVFYGAAKDQCNDRLSTSQHRAAPLGDRGAPQETGHGSRTATGNAPGASGLE